MKIDQEYGMMEVEVDGCFEWRRIEVHSVARNLLGRNMSSPMRPETQVGELLIERIGLDPVIITVTEGRTL